MVPTVATHRRPESRTPAREPNLSRTPVRPRRLVDRVAQQVGQLAVAISLAPTGVPEFETHNLLRA